MKTTFYQMDRVCTFLASRKVLLGCGAVKSAAEEAKKLGASRVLIVTDAGVVKTGQVDGIAGELEKGGLASSVFDKVLPEPPATIIDACAQKARDGGYDLIIGLGGGSSLDCAKAAAVLMANPGSVLDYAGLDRVPKRGAPTILIPTTAGTGSEATRVAVLTDERDNTKKVVYSDYLLPDAAILDPLLTLSLPPRVTADTGMDALVHAVETYVSVVTTPYAEVLALQAIGMIARHLPQAYAKGSSQIARYNMLLAANLSGSAFASGGLGAVHGLAYVLGTEYHMSHGRSNAILLPHVMEYNRVGNLEKYARIAGAMGENIQGLGPYEASEMAVKAVLKLMAAVNVSPRLSDYGIPGADLGRLVQGGLAQARLFVPNPRDLTENDVEEIYRRAL